MGGEGQRCFFVPLFYPPVPLGGTKTWEIGFYMGVMWREEVESVSKLTLPHVYSISITISIWIACGERDQFISYVAYS